MQVIEAPIYISEDGLRQFKTEAECVEYERFTRVRALLHKAVPHGSPSCTKAVNFILENWADIQSAMTQQPAPAQRLTK